MKDKNRTEKVDKDEKQNHICFVIMPFTTPEGYEDDHFRKIYDQIFKPAIEKAGYEATRVDEDNSSATIQTKILNQLINAEMVLCDLSAKNPNVLYELGIRHAFDKPVVLVQEKGQGAIFDIGNITTIPYRKERKYDEVLEDQVAITNAICQTKQSNQQYSVMSAINIEAAKPKKGEEITSTDQILYLLQGLSKRIDALDNESKDTINSNTENTYISRERFKSRIENYDKELDEILQLGETLLTRASSEKEKIDIRTLQSEAFGLVLKCDNLKSEISRSLGKGQIPLVISKKVYMMDVMEAQLEDLIDKCKKGYGKF